MLCNVKRPNHVTTVESNPVDSRFVIRHRLAYRIDSNQLFPALLLNITQDCNTDTLTRQKLRRRLLCDCLQLDQSRPRLYCSRHDDLSVFTVSTRSPQSPTVRFNALDQYIRLQFTRSPIALTDRSP